MDVSITERSFLSYLTILALVRGGLGALVLHYLEPKHYFGGYPLIPVCFYIFDVFYIYMFDACRRHAPDKMVMLFLIAEVLKMIISVFLLMIYCVAVPDSAVGFLLAFLAFYLGYLVYEGWFFFVFKWNQKLRKKSKKYETVA